MKNRKILALAGRLKDAVVREQVGAGSPSLADSGKKEIIQELSADLWKMETQKDLKMIRQTN